jgi:hypothetical protein
MRRLLLALSLLFLAACARYPVPTPDAPPPPATVVVASGPGLLETSTPVPPTATVPATPTELPPSPTSSPVPAREEGPAGLLRSPTPELRSSRTAVPSPTPLPPLETPTPLARLPLLPTATRTPARSASAIASLQRPTNTPAVRAPHYDFKHAQTLARGANIAGVVLAPGQSNIHRFDVGGGEGQVMVTVSGPDVQLYRTTLLSPDGAQAGPGLPVGAFGRAIRAPIRGQVGTWYVEVAVPAKAFTPSGPYTIRVDVRSGAG